MKKLLHLFHFFILLQDLCHILSRKYPCFVVLCSILAVLLFEKCCLPESMEQNRFLILNGVGIGLTLLSIPFFSLRDSCWKTAFPIFLILLSLVCHHLIRSDLPRQLKHVPCLIQAELQVIDSASSSRLTDLTPPNRILCRVLRFRFTEQDSWKDCRHSRILLRLSEKGKNTGKIQSLGYGDKIRVEGMITQAEKPLIPGAFDYGNYLKLNDIDFLFYADLCDKMQNGDGWKRKLFDCRDELIRRTVTYIPNLENRNMAMGILFGFRGGLLSQTKESFLKSGTIHILTVSGTHVGIFGLLMLLIFRFLPFSIRWVPALCFTGLYTCCTGLDEPAVRALLMYGVLLVHRTALYRTDPRNTLCLAAVILLL